MEAALRDARHEAMPTESQAAAIAGTMLLDVELQPGSGESNVTRSRLEEVRRMIDDWSRAALLLWNGLASARLDGDGAAGNVAANQSVSKVQTDARQFLTHLKRVAGEILGIVPKVTSQASLASIARDLHDANAIQATPAHVLDNVTMSFATATKAAEGNYTAVGVRDSTLESGTLLFTLPICDLRAVVESSSSVYVPLLDLDLLVPTTVLDKLRKHHVDSNFARTPRSV